MGVLAEEALNLGGQVIGVITEDLRSRGVCADNLTELLVVESMGERKSVMSKISDGFIALPGGFGTLDEFLEVVTEAQLGYHVKPCGILNVNGFYDEFLRFIDQATTKGFIHKTHSECILSDTNPKKLIEKMTKYESKSMDMATWAIQRNKKNKFLLGSVDI